MNEMFFYQESGKTVGPFSAEDIKGRIKEGKIRVFDLLYKDGEPSWRMALEHPSLRAEFKATSLSSLKEKPWVCLQKKGAGFVTTGPFTQEEIRDAIQNGKISYSDYAWKESLAEWKRIGSLEEFNARVRQSVLPPVPEVPKESAKELLKNVIEYQRGLPVNKFAEPPAEASVDFLPPPDLFDAVTKTQIPAITAKIKAATPPPVEVKKSTEPVKPAESIKTPEPPNAQATPKTQEPPPITFRVITATHKAEPKPQEVPPPPKPEPKAEIAKLSEQTGDADGPELAAPKRRWLDWSLVAALVLVLIGAVLLVSRFVVIKPNVVLPEPPAETTAAVEAAPPPPPIAAQPPLPPPVKPEPPPAIKPEAPTSTQVSAPVEPPAPPKKPEPPPPQHEPSELVLAVHAAGSGPPQIEVRTDGSAEFPVHLQILGLPGQVSEGGSYYRFMRLTPNGKLREAIEVPSLKLPQGKFIVRAEAGEIKKESKFSWGLNDPQFKVTVNRQRKAWAFALWKERLNLFALSQALEKQVTQALVPSKKFQSKPWEKLIALKRTDGKNYLMFDEWWELHNIAKDAKTGVNSALAARAAKERDHLATFSVWK